MMLSDAQQIMVEENLGLVRAVLSRCVNNPGSMGIYSYDDLFQIGCIGLCKAAAQYQPGRAVFSTYAYIAIRNHIYNALAYATYRQEKEVLSEFLYEPPLSPQRTLGKQGNWVSGCAKPKANAKALPARASMQ